MNKLFIGILVILVIGLGWFLLSDSPKEMVSEEAVIELTIQNEVEALENDLAEIEAAVTAGRMTEEQATEAKVRIIERLAQIDASTKVDTRTLTPAQRLELAAGLERLAGALSKYQATLAAVDEMANDEEVEARVQTKISGMTGAGRTNYDVYTGAGTSLSDMVDELVESVEELKETVDEMVEEETSEASDEPSDEEAARESSEEETDESATTEETEASDEAMSPEEATSTEESTGDSAGEESTEEMTISIEAEAEIEDQSTR